VNTIRYARRNPTLVVGLALLLSLFLFTLIGHLVLDLDQAYPLRAPTAQPPSQEHPFGTDDHGRDLLTVAVRGTYLTIRIGFTAGIIALAVGTFLGFLSAFVGGKVDSFIRWVVDVLITVPGLVILIVIATMLKKGLSVGAMALIIALMAWMWPTRIIRSQVLSLRERGFVRVARLSGQGTVRIIVAELMPNLLPFLGAALVGAMMSGVFSAIGLEVLGLGSQREPTLGMTIFWLMTNSAFMRGMWWWIAPPVGILIILFVGLFLTSKGLDELANPRLRRQA
jgi:peptide/nickel transport system permease protein